VRAGQQLVAFELREAQTEWGESILAVGEAPGLGCWEPRRAARLNTRRSTYPRWRCAPLRPRPAPAGQKDTSSSDSELDYLRVIRYKYVRDRRALGGGFVWEDAIADREASLPRAAPEGHAWLIHDAGFDVPGSGGVTLLRLVEATPRRCPAMEACCAPEGPAEGPPTLAAELRAAVPERTPEPQSPEPRRFEHHFRLLGEYPVGRGGFSSVWRCRAHRGGAELVAKRIDSSKMPVRNRRFLFGSGSREGEIALHASLRHPNIVELVEAFDGEPVVCLVMERCFGGNLLEITLDRHRKTGLGLPEAGAASAIRQLLSALAFLHGQRVIHRDVKCENVFRADRPDEAPLELAVFKLGDFGLAARVLPEQMLLEQVGSPSTSAPEIARGRPYAALADVWSMGVTAYTALAARRPFQAETAAQVLKLVAAARRHVTFDCCVEKAISVTGRDFVGRLLQPDAQQRPSALEALRHPWVCGNPPAPAAA